MLYFDVKQKFKVIIVYELYEFNFTENLIKYLDKM